MERPNTVAGLKAKRKVLENELKAAKKAAKAIKIDIHHIDAAIRLFTDDTPRVIPRHDVQFRAERGEMRRHVTKCLRDATAPLTSQQITEAWCEKQGLEANHETYVLIRKRVGACLNTLKHSGTIEAVNIPGEFKGWKVKTPS